MACHLTTLASSKANVKIAIGVPIPAPPKYDVETGIAALQKDSQPRPKGEQKMEKRRKTKKDARCCGPRIAVSRYVITRHFHVLMICAHDYAISILPILDWSGR